MHSREYLINQAEKIKSSSRPAVDLFFTFDISSEMLVLMAADGILTFLLEFSLSHSFAAFLRGTLIAFK